MPKKLIQGLTWLFVTLPVMVLAQDVDSIMSKDIFKVGGYDAATGQYVTDPTKDYLAQMFGTVGGVLQGTSGQLLGQIFRIFNIGILSVAGIFFVWTLAQTIMNTAHEGQFMGGNKSKPAFTILRTVAGFGLLVPNLTTGFSMIQVGVMWIIIQGVGFANSGWVAALEYFEQGGVALATPSAGSAVVVDMIGTLLLSQVCMKYYQEKEGPGTVFTPRYTTVNNIDGRGTIKYLVSVPKRDQIGDSGCGQFYWTETTQVSASDAAKGIAPESDKNKGAWVTAGVKEVFIQTETAAEALANPTVSDAMNPDLVKTKVVEGVINAAAAWTNSLLTLRSDTGSMDAQMEAFFENAKKDGWLFAGSYYYKLTSMQAKFSAANSIGVITSAAPYGVGGIALNQEDPLVYLPMTNEEEPTVTVDKDLTGQALYDRYLKTSSLVASARKAATQLDTQVSGAKQLTGVDAGMLTPMVAPIMDGINMALGSMAGEGQGTAVDPVVILKQAGDKMTITVAIVFIVATLIIFIIQVLACILSSANPLCGAVRDMLNMLLALFTPILLIIWTEGVLLGLYVPLIPFTIFTFAAIGWFVVVVETLVAAPLVALGLTHPEGHDLMGVSQQAVMMLLNVFLRPILMIIGLFAGMLLSKIGLQILGKGFGTIIADMKLNLFLVLAMVMVYISMIVSVLNMAYGLITHVPDNIMKWVGLTQGMGPPSVQEAIGASKAAAEKGGKAVGDSLQGASTQLKSVSDSAEKRSLSNKDKGGGSAE